MLKVKGKSEANLIVGNSEVEEVDGNVFKDGGGTSDIRKRIAIASFRRLGNINLGSLLTSAGRSKFLFSKPNHLRIVIWL